jgi:hypothetical protein
MDGFTSACAGAEPPEDLALLLKPPVLRPQPAQLLALIGGRALGAAGSTSPGRRQSHSVSPDTPSSAANCLIGMPRPDQLDRLLAQLRLNVIVWNGSGAVLSDRGRLSPTGDRLTLGLGGPTPPMRGVVERCYLSLKSTPQSAVSEPRWEWQRLVSRRGDSRPSDPPAGHGDGRAQPGGGRGAKASARCHDTGGAARAPKR